MDNCSKNHNNNPLVIIAGPTATGKSALAVELAKKINGAVISADSMQVYKHMDIGSAKVTEEEMRGVPHCLIDELEPSEEFNVAKFKEMANAALDEIYENGQIPIVCGGTGFYIQALLYDVDFTSEDDGGKLRRELEEFVRENGEDALYERLREVDPKSCETIHKNNQKRIIRALEYYGHTGRPISEHNAEQRKNKSGFNFLYFVLTDRRDRLYARIEERVDKMIENGLVDEVRHLRDMGCHRGMVSMQGLGYKEILDCLDGKISLDEAIYTIKRETRHFAKRQLTWFRRERDVIWLDREKYGYGDEEILSVILKKLKEKGIIQD
ncbi:MAG: tRNA (adenosine(37)-N6)-dimethylallyltransferase MiaA [Clostridiales bacterium]|nr:tRNA (adenosine(37)-N6)-dimethylallyltransferase MiaA [Clostridiales bacterium]